MRCWGEPGWLWWRLLREPVVVDRQLRADVTVFAVGWGVMILVAHTVDTRELHEDVLREAGDVAIAVEKGALV